MHHKGHEGHGRSNIDNRKDAAVRVIASRCDQFADY
jgi:hypothetical protein